MAALDLLGRRWALRVLWELRGGGVGARDLRARCDSMSSSVLYQRLGELSAAGLVAQDDAGLYVLTDLGRSLGDAIQPLDAWARRWSREQERPEEAAPATPPAPARSASRTGAPPAARSRPGRS
jgi:DNA-binding HxlR family transcriptional regulator